MKNNPRILVVDDDPNLRKTLSDILRIKGYEVVAAGTGAEGIAEAGRAFVNVTLIDLKLPDMSGIEVMESIKLSTPLTEAIILTGHAALDTAIEATNKGAFSYLLKPYEIDNLLQHIRHAIDRQLGQQEILSLASFPRLNPDPVIELNSSSEVTYLNPAAGKLFPDLILQGMKHPAIDGLQDMFAVFRNGELRESTREFAVGKRYYEERVYFVPESDHIRVTTLDITALKEREVKLTRLNLLLLTIRSINEYLLVAESEEALFRFVCGVLKGFDDIVGVIIAIRLPDYVLKPIAWAGFSEAMISTLVVRWDVSELGAGVMGTAAREEKLIIAADIENDARYLPWQEIVRTWQLKSAAGVPLIADGKELGVLAVYSVQRNAFDEETANFLAEVANNIAVGVHALRLDKNLHVTLNHLRSSMNSTVEAIARIVELRDPYTAGHERRVAQLACAIGKEMGLPERQVEGLRIIGHLHDIGKISVPAEILSKPSKLLEIEFALVKMHSQTGYDILKDLEFPWPVAQAVLQHHERLDGSGYPQGLKGPDIILEARILMVADVVEAMASHRPYRAAIGLEKAIAEIAANRGKFYDEQVVDTCISLLTEKGFKFDSSF